MDLPKHARDTRRIMSDKNRPRLERLFDRIERGFPLTRRALHVLRQPWARLIRIPLGMMLIVGGLLSFLPVLGLWMLPLGLLLLAIDIPMLRHPVNRTLITGQRRWTLWRRRRRPMGR